jgi:dTDP-glucose pyrophosphorylase|tara:strand:+ start:1104 stop:1835 length:732 start_codon:yes stop_codon:yes gene_type:complete
MKQFFNIVLPMAGRGSRFREQGYQDSKPFIDVNGKPMIQRVIENLNIEFDNKFKFIIITQKADYQEYDYSLFNDIIGHTNIELVLLDGITEGAACTLLAAKAHIDNRTPLLSFNSDQLIEYDPNKTFSRLSLHDGGMPCFKGEGPKWSYAKTDEEGYVTEVAEKKQISNQATAGYYYWNRGSDFVKYAEKMIKANDRVNNEFYVAPVYNYAVADGKHIVTTQVDNIYQMGTPEDLESYLNGEQ